MVKCEACDKNHHVSKCPWYKKARSTHPDAQMLANKTNVVVAPDSAPITAKGRLEKMPPDGSCLYHTLARGLYFANKRGGSQQTLRSKLATWVNLNGQRSYNGATLETWLQREFSASLTAEKYADIQRQGSRWGGWPEIVGTMFLFNVNVWVWLPLGGGSYRRMQCFNHPGHARETIHAVLRGSVHYDHLTVTSVRLARWRPHEALSHPLSCATDARAVGRPQWPGGAAGCRG